MSNDWESMFANKKETESVMKLEKNADCLNDFVKELSKLRSDSWFCDVTLVGKSTRISAHRVILAASSDYFKTILANAVTGTSMESLDMVDMKASSQQIEVYVEIEDAALVALVNFCYTGVIEVNHTNVLNVLSGACLLQLSDVQDLCGEFLEKEMNTSNCLKIRSFAEKYTCRKLLRFADKYILYNFQEVIGSEDYLLLTHSLILNLISSDELNARSEEQVFAAVIHWVKFDLTTRKQFLFKLLEHVRLPICHPRFLVDTVSKNELVKSDAGCRDLVDEAKDHQLLDFCMTERLSLPEYRVRPRKVFCGEIIYVVGGWTGDHAITSAERFDPEEANAAWQHLPPTSKKRDGLAVLDHMLYAIGGGVSRSSETYWETNERYDPITNRWTTNVAPLNTKRSELGLAALGGFLYAVGGIFVGNSLDVVERYDARRNEWTYVAPLGRRRYGLSVSVLNGCLYAIGGCDGEEALNIVERFDPRVGTWETIRPMSTCRKFLGTAVLDDHLYAVGGQDKSNCYLNSAEVYNPSTNEWIAGADMNKQRSGLGLVVANGRLYALGGTDGSDQETVEVFDIQTNQWKNHSRMNEARRSLVATAMRIPSQF